MTDSVADKKKRVRSPNYPAVNLEDALSKAKAFYEQEDRHEANVEVASKHWGYKNAAAGGGLIVAALTSFGLMEDEGAGTDRKVRLSPMGLRLVMPGSPSRKKDLEIAALSPKIHQELWDKWGASMPSVESMRFYLLSERGFNRGTVDTFIDEYRHTTAFAGLLNGGKISLPTRKIEVNFKEGDYVQWESQGVLQFEAKKVTGFSEDGLHAFVEGSNTGLPVEQLAKVDTLTESEKGPTVISSGKIQMRIGPKPGMNQDVFTLEEGDVTIQWPKTLSKASYQDFEDWLELIKRKAKRAIPGLKRSSLASADAVQRGPDDPADPEE